MSAKKEKPEQADSASSNGKPLDSANKPECFVIMPISDPDSYEAGHFRRVYEDLFIPACNYAGYKAVRADEVRQTNLIHLDVLQKIINSPMALCDLSSQNPNVLFELGLRQAFDKPVVLVQEVGTPAIFDINPLRYTTYKREMFYRQVIEDQKEIAEAINETKKAIGDSKSINSIVKLLSLTQASLTNFSEGDKDAAFLQVLATELSNLRSEMKDLFRHDQESKSIDKAVRRENPQDTVNGIRLSINQLHLKLLRLQTDHKLVPDISSDLKSLQRRITAVAVETSTSDLSTQSLIRIVYTELGNLLNYYSNISSLNRSETE